MIVDASALLGFFAPSRTASAYAAGIAKAVHPRISAGEIPEVRR